jgi:2TM family of unknown function (DUF5676)
MSVVDTSGRSKTGLPLASHGARTISVLAFGMSLSLFFVISYVICIIGYLIFPGLPINHAALAIFLPGFELLTWQTFLLGLIESFVWGWYIALIFGPLFNFFAHRNA